MKKRYKFLSTQEQAVLNCYLDGMSQADTANYLQLAVSTVKHHTKSLHKKYNVDSTLLLVVNHYKQLLGE